MPSIRWILFKLLQTARNLYFHENVRYEMEMDGKMEARDGLNFITGYVKRFIINLLYSCCRARVTTISKTENTKNSPYADSGNKAISLNNLNVKVEQSHLAFLLLIGRETKTKKNKRKTAKQTTRRSERTMNNLQEWFLNGSHYKNIYKCICVTKSTKKVHENPV